MLPVHLLRTAGVGMLGPPGRLLPLPFASVKPLFITGRMKEKHISAISPQSAHFTGATAKWDGDEQIKE